MLLTSRVALPPLPELAVGPLDIDAAVELFLRRLDATSGHRPDPAALRALVAALDRLPLALELAAARVGLVPVDRLADRLDWLRRGEGRHGSLEACVAASWDALEPREQRVLGLCSSFPAGFDLPLLEAAAGPEALEALEALQAASLVHPLQAGRLTLLDTIRWFVARHAPADAAECAADGLLGAGGNRELDNARALVAGSLPPERVAALVERYASVMLAMAPLDEVGRWMARGQQGARAAGDTDAALRLRRVDPHLRQWSGDTVGALTEAEAFLAEATAAGAERWIAIAMRDRSTFLRRLGRVDDAIEQSTTAVERAREVAPDLHANTLSELAEALCDAGRHEQALPVLDQALALHIAAGDRHKEALRVGARGRALRSLGRPRASLAHYTRSLDLFRELGDQANEAVYLGNLGQVLTDLERYPEALDAFAASTELAEVRGDALTLAHLRYGRGRTLRLAGSLQAACAELVTAIYRFEALAQPGPVATCRAELALALAAQGAMTEAATELAEAESILAEHGLPVPPTLDEARERCLPGAR